MKENVPWMPGLYVSVDGDIFELGIIIGYS